MLLFANILSNPTIFDPVTGTLIVGRCVGGRFEFSSGKKKSNVKDDEPFDDLISVGASVGDSVGLRNIFTEGSCVGLRDNATEGLNVGLKVVGNFEGDREGLIVGHCVGAGFDSCSGEKKSKEKKDSNFVDLLSLGESVGFRVTVIGAFVGFRVTFIGAFVGFILPFVGSCVGLLEEAVGFKVGATVVGDIVGRFVGKKVGEGDGFGVDLITSVGVFEGLCELESESPRSTNLVRMLLDPSSSQLSGLSFVQTLWVIHL